MTSGSRARAAERGGVGRGLLVCLALVWLLLAGVLLGTPPVRTHAAAASAAGSTPTYTPSSSATYTPVPSTPTVAPTATGAATTAPTAGATATTQATDVPTDTPSSNSSGSSSGNSGGAVGPQPTRQNLAQPTVGASQGGPTSAFSSSDLSSPGILIFSTLGCVFGLLGLGAALVTWYLLVSEGWGPLLKAVLLGNRKGQRRFTRRPPGPERGSRPPERKGDPAASPRGNWR